MDISLFTTSLYQTELFVHDIIGKFDKINKYYTDTQAAFLFDLFYLLSGISSIFYSSYIFNDPSIYKSVIPDSDAFANQLFKSPRFRNIYDSHTHPVEHKLLCEYIRLMCDIFYKMTVRSAMSVQTKNIELINSSQPRIISEICDHLEVMFLLISLLLKTTEKISDDVLYFYMQPFYFTTYNLLTKLSIIHFDVFGSAQSTIDIVLDCTFLTRSMFHDFTPLAIQNRTIALETLITSMLIKYKTITVIIPTDETIPDCINSIISKFSSELIIKIEGDILWPSN